MTNSAQSILKTYMRRLTGLSGSNRSLLLLRINSEQLLDVQSLSQLNGEPAFEIIVSLIAGKDKKICPVLDSRMETVNEASKKLKRLQRIEKFIYEERGSHDLHVGWPVLRGKLADGTLVRAPMLYFPVELVQDKSDWLLKIRRDAGVTFNKSFLLAYFFYNQVVPDEALLECDFEEFDTDSTVFRTQLYQLIKNKLEINFNPDTFTDQLIPFQDFKKKNFDEQHRNGEIKLFPEAVLGIFPQAGSQLVPDYLELIEENKYATFDDFFAAKSNATGKESVKDPVAVNLAVPEEKVYAPFPLDAWQEHAIKLSKLGRSLVVQGPPGTGKSQLICNLISDSIASGKRVLLVCQKRVALDVVYDRLKQVELNDFVGLVHDFRDDRKPIYQKIAKQIDRVEDFKAQNRSIDAIQTERKFVQSSRTIDRHVEELEEFRHALFNDSECGLSAKELYLTSDPTQMSVNLTQHYQHFHFNDIGDFTRKLGRYAKYAQQIESEEYGFRQRKSFSTFTLSDRKEIEKCIEEIPSFQREMAHQLEKLVDVSLNLEDCEALLQRKEDVNEMVKYLADETVFRFFLAMAQEKDEETSLLWIQNMERLVLNCFDGHGVERTLPNNHIGQCQSALQKRMLARRNWIRLVRWELFSEHKFFLKRVLISNGLLYNKKGLQTLENRIDNRLNLEHHLTALRVKSWLIEFPKTFDGKAIKLWFDRQKSAIRAKLLASSLREIRGGLNATQYTRDEFIRLIWSVFDALEPFPDHKARWQKYLSDYQIRSLTHNPDQAEALIKLLHRDFDQLKEYDAVKESLHAHEKEIVDRLHDMLNDWEADSYVRVFQNSLRLAWIEHLETKYPVLRSVSTLRMEEIQNELQHLVEEKRTLSKEILLLRARERICESIEYNRLNNRITYRSLRHQVTKRRKIWPIRKVIAEFHAEVFQLLPCWMASPESVSAIFPLKEMFDLVIFDEASQCFAERGIPAISRGKQVIVAGDNKQLKPYELYQSRWEEDQEDVELDVESLLELSGTFIETVYLNGHYRSKSLELIEFSNRHFYSGKLNLLPDKIMLDKYQPAIEYHKLEGVWEDQTNPVEAEKVVHLVYTLMVDLPDKDIGVVTFNQPQQVLIMDLLERETAQAGRQVPANLFVKNIENVQGDEKDIIIFSVGYAPDKHGKVSMQFGSLNVAGGENRLNVAITRAREKVIIISSVWPEDLRIQGIKNEGPKLLRAYLEFAREVSVGNFKPAPREIIRQNPEWYLSANITRWSEQDHIPFTFVSQALPFADLTLSNSHAFEGIILTDDSRYFQALSAKDVHVYEPYLLALKHWPFLRVFSRNWWAHREKTIHELTKYQFQLQNRKVKPD